MAITEIDKLIFGKNNTKNIVSLEANGNICELFVQQSDGSIISQFVNNKYWILAAYNPGGWKRMNGNLWYKWGKQFDNREEFVAARQQYKKFDIFSIFDPKESFMVNTGYTYFKGLKPKDVSILSFDIETTGFSGHNDKLLLISNTYRNGDKIVKKLFAYDDYETDAQFIDAWTSWVREQNPSIICGHNIYSFDFPFLAAVAEKAGTQLSLGRDDSPITFQKYSSEFRKDGSQTISYNKVRCYGRELIDTMFLAIKYDIAARKYESYGLKKIIEQEGIRFEGREMYDASLIRERFEIPAEWQKIKRYCIHDSDEALQLFDLMAPAQFYLTQSVPKSFQSVIESATGSQINAMMIRSYLQDAHSLPHTTNAEAFDGAISIGVPGIYNNCLRYDVSSLYPSIIRQYQIGLGDKDPNNYFLKIVDHLTVERLKNKNLAKTTGDVYYKDLQESMKITINSAYGFMGARGLLFNNPPGASKITQLGREILEKATIWATSKSLKNFQTSEEKA